MILQSLLLILILSLSCSPILGNEPQSDALIKESVQKIEYLQDEIIKLSTLQKELKNKKQELQSELQTTNEQLTKTCKQQEDLNHEMQSLSESTQQITQENSELNQKIKSLEEEKSTLERTILQLNEQINSIELESATKTSLEILRLHKTIHTQQDIIDDCSWSNAFDRHIFKLVTAFALGNATMYVALYFHP